MFQCKEIIEDTLYCFLVIIKGMSPKVGKKSLEILIFFYDIEAEGSD